MVKHVIISDTECSAFSKRLDELREKICTTPSLRLDVPSFLDDLHEKTQGMSSGQKRCFYPSGNKFNANEFFHVFNKVRLHEGYYLDYFYTMDNLAGWPIVFARKEEDDPATILDEGLYEFSDYMKYLKRFLTDYALSKHIEFEKSAEGYFQFSIFNTVVHQFYLFWHANYDDKEFILTKEKLEETLRYMETNYGIIFSDEELDLINDLNLNPEVKIKNDNGIVRVISFSKNAGFYQEDRSIKWPNLIEINEDICLVKLETTIKY